MKGKLSIDELEDVVIKHLTYKHPDVLTRASVGEDCAAVDFGEDVLIISSDPITGTSKGLGTLAVNINLNDLATTGCRPIGIMLTILAPPDTLKSAISEVVQEAATIAKSYEVEVIGGHTEWTEAVNQIVVSVTAIGKQDKRQFISRPNIQSGDLIAVTKTVGIEGIGILAYEHEALLSKYLNEDELSTAKSLLNHTSVVKEGVVARRFNPSAMHDVTEGGLLGGIWELCYGAGMGCIIDAQKIPIQPISQRLATLFKIDILRIISSGTMLIVASEHTMPMIGEALKKENIDLTVIGKMTNGDKCLVKGEGDIERIAPPKGDALFSVDVHNLKV